MAILDDLPKPRGSDNEGDLFRNQAKNLHDALAKIPGLKKYKNQIETSVTREGLRISLLESKNTPLFQLGGVTLHKDAIPVLETIGQEIRRSGKSIVIEGHTDSKKYSAGSERTNWELSTGRAQTARRIFEKAGVPEDRILEIRGFADRKLYNPLDPLDSRNRRISITLLSDKMMAEHKELPSAKLIPWLAK